MFVELVLDDQGFVKLLIESNIKPNELVEHVKSFIVECAKREINRVPVGEVFTVGDVVDCVAEKIEENGLGKKLVFTPVYVDAPITVSSPNDKRAFEFYGEELANKIIEHNSSDVEDFDDWEEPDCWW